MNAPLHRDPAVIADPRVVDMLMDTPRAVNYDYFNIFVFFNIFNIFATFPGMATSG